MWPIISHTNKSFYIVFGVEEEVETNEEELDPEEELKRKREAILDDGRVAGITVHRTDKLKTDFQVLHPLVRVSIVDLNSGKCLLKQNK